MAALEQYSERQVMAGALLRALRHIAASHQFDEFRQWRQSGGDGQFPDPAIKQPVNFNGSILLIGFSYCMSE
jgi:hypothetical protein